MLHARFRELMLHAAVRHSLWCPVYCLMPDHIHLIWMGMHPDSDQRLGMRFLRSELTPMILPFRFQHQPHDHVLAPDERTTTGGGLACAAYVLQNPVRAGLVAEARQWKYAGAVVPGYTQAVPWRSGFWEWYWGRYHGALDPAL